MDKRRIHITTHLGYSRCSHRSLRSGNSSALCPPHATHRATQKTARQNLQPVTVSVVDTRKGDSQRRRRRHLPGAPHKCVTPFVAIARKISPARTYRRQTCTPPTVAYHTSQGNEIIASFWPTGAKHVAMQKHSSPGAGGRRRRGTGRGGRGTYGLMFCVPNSSRQSTDHVSPGGGGGGTHDTTDHSHWRQ